MAKERDGNPAGCFMVILFGFFGLLFIIISTDPDIKKHEEQQRIEAAKVKIYTIYRVIMNSPIEYTVFTKSGDVLIPSVLRSSGYGGPQGNVNSIKLVADVPPTEHMFVREQYKNVEIHIHSEKDIGAGNWSRMNGKHRETGSSEVIE